MKLQNILEIKGTRFIDDYYLYFESQARLEQTLALLHKIAKEFELGVNDPKTEIMQLPEELEPAWKTELRGMQLRPSGQPQNTDLIVSLQSGLCSCP